MASEEMPAPNAYYWVWIGPAARNRARPGQRRDSRREQRLSTSLMPDPSWRFGAWTQAMSCRSADSKGVQRSSVIRLAWRSILRQTNSSWRTRTLASGRAPSRLRHIVEQRPAMPHRNEFWPARSLPCTIPSRLQLLRIQRHPQSQGDSEQRQRHQPCQLLHFRRCCAMGRQSVWRVP